MKQLNLDVRTAYSLDISDYISYSLLMFFKRETYHRDYYCLFSIRGII